MEATVVATDAARPAAQVIRYGRLQNVSFALLCLLLTLMTLATLRARVLWSWTTPDVWGLTPLAWVLLDVALALAFAVLVVRPRLVLTMVAFWLVGGELVFQLAAPIVGRYTAALTLLALFVAGLVAVALSGWGQPRPWRTRLLNRPGRLFAVVLAILLLATVAASLLAWAHYEAPARTYAGSPDGRWSLVYISGGAQDFFPSLDVSRDAWGLLRDVRPLAAAHPPLTPRWLSSYTVAAYGHRYDIQHLDWQPQP